MADTALPAMSTMAAGVTLKNVELMLMARSPSRVISLKSAAPMLITMRVAYTVLVEDAAVSVNILPASARLALLLTEPLAFDKDCSVI